MEISFQTVFTLFVQFGIGRHKIAAVVGGKQIEKQTTFKTMAFHAIQISVLGLQHKREQNASIKHEG